MARKIKIVYLIGQLAIGGTELQLLELIRNLAWDKFEVRVICLSGKKTELVDRYIQAGFPPFLLNREKWGRFATTLKLFQTIKSFDPDIVHSFSYASRAGILVAKLLGRIKTVISFRNDPERWVSFWDRILINKVDLILENSNHALLSYQILNGGGALKTKMVPNGIDLNLFDLTSKKEIVNLPASQILSSKIVICTVSRLVQQKHVDDLLQACSLFLQYCVEIELWVVGDGVLRGKLENLSRDLKIQGNVYFWGIRSDVPSILRYATMGVQTSEYEGLPNSIVEYMASSLPVIATNVRGTNELVIDRETGVLVPFGNPKSLADAMFSIIQNPKLARQYGQAGRNRVEKLFSIGHMVSETEAAYDELVKS